MAKDNVIRLLKLLILWKKAKVSKPEVTAVAKTQGQCQRQALILTKTGLGGRAAMQSTLLTTSTSTWCCHMLLKIWKILRKYGGANWHFHKISFLKRLLRKLGRLHCFSISLQKVQKRILIQSVQHFCSKKWPPLIVLNSMLALIDTVPTDWGSYQLLTFRCHNNEASITQLDWFVIDTSDVCAIIFVKQKTMPNFEW